MSSVLYYDRDPDGQERARRSSANLPGGTRVIVAATYGEAARYLKEEPVDAVVTDPRDDDVLPLLSLVRESRGLIPFVLFMAPGREKIAVAAFNSGATQYIEKGDDGTTLTALEAAIGPTLPRAGTTRLERRAQHLEFLTRTALDFVGMDDGDDVYEYIGEKVHDLCRGRSSGSRLLRSGLAHPDPSGRRRPPGGAPDLRREARPELRRWQLPIDASSSAESALRSQSLIEGPSTTPALFRTVPEEVGDRIDERLGPGRTFILGFPCREGVYGTVIVRLLSGGAFANRDLVEAFVGQASVALLRRHARERLVESEARYRAVVESQQELVCRFRPDGTHLVANEAYCRFFGLDPTTIVGSRFVPVIPGRERRPSDAYFRWFSPDRPDGTIEHRVVVTGRVRALAPVVGPGVLRPRRYRRGVPVGRPRRDRAEGGGGGARRAHGRARAARRSSHGRAPGGEPRPRGVHVPRLARPPRPPPRDRRLPRHPDGTVRVGPSDGRGRPTWAGPGTASSAPDGSSRGSSRSRGSHASRSTWRRSRRSPWSGPSSGSCSRT